MMRRRTHRWILGLSLLLLGGGGTLFVVAISVRGSGGLFVPAVICLILGFAFPAFLLGERALVAVLGRTTRFEPEYSILAPPPDGCPTCGYALAGLDGIFCPECGTVRPAPIAGARDDRVPDPPRSPDDAADG